MQDPRYDRLATILLNYSLGIRPGDKLLINAPPLATPLITAVYRAALQAGAFPETQVELEDLREVLLREGSDEQLRHVSQPRVWGAGYYDALLSIGAAENTRALSGIDPHRIALAHQAQDPWRQIYSDRTARRELRRCGTLFPTQAYAQDAGMSLAEYEDFVFAACLLDRPDPVGAWRELYDSIQRIADYLSAHDTLHFVAPDIDLTCRVGGRIWINSSGSNESGSLNFPSGEVYTAPLEDSTNGTVRFNYPAIYLGNEVEDVRLTFRDGQVVDATAARGEAFLHSMLAIDPGARALGEIAFGLHYGITRFTRNILFDEKIGGTMHMALGRAYPNTGGSNDSALHWDLIADLRAGQVYADGERCYTAGHFTIG